MTFVSSQECQLKRKTGNPVCLDNLIGVIINMQVLNSERLRVG